MNFKKFILFFSMLIMSILLCASTTMSEDEINNIDRTEVSGDEMRQRLSITAGLLTEYEIEAKKLVSNLSNGTSADIRKQAITLLKLSEKPAVVTNPSPVNVAVSPQVIKAGDSTQTTHCPKANGIFKKSIASVI